MHMALAYWGPIDAMHQFCEAKYDVSPLIAEFYNSLSNIPTFILPGLYCIYRGWGILDLRLQAIWLSMVVVGIGSLMFHGTMRFKWEMLDELPMLVLVISAIVAKDDTHWLMSGWRKVLIHVIGISGCVAGMWLYIGLGNYEYFLHTFTFIIVLDVFLAFVCVRQPDKHGSRVGLGCLMMYAITLSSGRVFWEAENRLCPAGSGNRLAFFHVIWHALAGLACYFGTLGNVQTRYATLGIGEAVDAPGKRWPLIGLVNMFGKQWTRCSDAAAGETAKKHK